MYKLFNNLRHFGASVLYVASYIILYFKCRCARTVLFHDDSGNSVCSLNGKRYHLPNYNWEYCISCGNMIATCLLECLSAPQINSFLETTLARPCGFSGSDQCDKYWIYCNMLQVLFLKKPLSTQDCVTVSRYIGAWHFFLGKLTYLITHPCSFLVQISRIVLELTVVEHFFSRLTFYIEETLINWHISWTLKESFLRLRSLAVGMQVLTFLFIRLEKK